MHACMQAGRQVYMHVVALAELQNPCIRVCTCTCIHVHTYMHTCTHVQVQRDEAQDKIDALMSEWEELEALLAQ